MITRAKRPFLLSLFIAATAWTCGAGLARGDVTQISSPAEMSAVRTTLDFDGLEHLTPVNTAYEPLGVRLARDNGGPVLTYRAELAGYQPHSGDSFIGAPDYRSIPSSQELDVIFASPVREVGAYFGNDPPGAGHSFRLSVFGAGGESLGSVEVQSNENYHVDQFLGLRSDTPFVRARFEQPTPLLSFAIDDLTFPSLPEPSTGALGVCVFLSALRRPHVMTQRRRRRAFHFPPRGALTADVQ